VSQVAAKKRLTFRNERVKVIAHFREEKWLNHWQVAEGDMMMHEYDTSEKQGDLRI
jgi:hypothetical protein